MNNILLQPCGNKVAQEHFNDTIRTKIYLDSIREHITKNEFEDLEKIYPGRACSIWGVAAKPSNISKWGRIKTGDLSLFSGQGRIFASGVTAYKLQNKNLAHTLWGVDDSGITWEYLYFLDEIRQLDISYLEFNRIVGYNENYVIQGFNVLDDNRSSKFLKFYELESDLYTEDIQDYDYQEAINKLSALKEPEVEYLSLKRNEQAYLKKALFGRKSMFTCACCHRVYPVSFLITAHIKKRSFCTIEEKLDSRIVMPMCRFGCDELFEKGYVSVISGKFITLNKQPITTSVERYIEKVDGNKCKYYDTLTRGYFQWHYNFHKY